MTFRNSPAQGMLSPLPPVEALQKLRNLVTENSTNDDENGRSRLSQASWTLLRRKVLMPLSGIIGADGRGGHTAFKLLHQRSVPWVSQVGFWDKHTFLSLYIPSNLNLQSDLFCYYSSEPFVAVIVGFGSSSSWDRRHNLRPSCSRSSPCKILFGPEIDCCCSRRWWR